MKMKFKALIATDKIDSSGECFSKEALIQMGKSVIGKPVSVAFIHKLPGQIDNSEVDLDAGKLFVSGVIGKLEQSELKNIGKLYAVPGFIKDGDGNLKMVEVGITHHPTDENLTPIDMELSND